MIAPEHAIAKMAVYIFLRRDGKILFGRRVNTGYQDGSYQMPAGHIDQGETPLEAMVREAKEEVGVTVRPEDLRFVHTLYRIKHDYTHNRVDYFFETDKWEGEPYNAEPEKCDDLLWVSEDALPTNTVPHVREVIASIKRGEIYSELGAEFFKALGYTV